MGLETATYISDLVTTNPAATDQVSTADDHLRLIKSTLQTTFPSITGAVTGSHTDINNAIPISKIKGSATSRTSTTTLSDDADIKSISLAASASYSFEMYLPLSCSTTTTQGIKFTIAYTGTLSNSGMGLIGVINNAAYSAFGATSDTQTFANISLGSKDFLVLKGHIITSTSGTLSLQWAQASSSTNASTISTGAYFKATRLV